MSDNTITQSPEPRKRKFAERVKPHPDPILAAEGFFETFLERFWSKVRKTEGCWLWTGSGGQDGYGHIHKGSRAGRQISAPSASWIIHFGPIPKGFEICHSCDVNYPPGDKTYRLCVRPDHLHLATHVDNIREMVDKGRTAKGEMNAFHKLTTEQVLQIRQRYQKGVLGHGCKSLGREFGVSFTTIRRIIRRQKWDHV